MNENSDPMIHECSSCTRLWNRVETLEKVIQKKDKQAAHQLLASGVLLGVILINFLLQLL